MRLEDNLINQDPLFVDEKACDFQLREDSPAWALGFQRIPFAKIGLYPEEPRPSQTVTSCVRFEGQFRPRKILVLDAARCSAR